MTLGGLPDGSHDVRVLLEAKLAKSPHCGLRGEATQVNARTNSANDRQVGLQDVHPVLDQFMNNLEGVQEVVRVEEASGVTSKEGFTLLNEGFQRFEEGTHGVKAVSDVVGLDHVAEPLVESPMTG